MARKIMDRWIKRCRVTERALPLSSLFRWLAKRLVLLFIQLREIVLARLFAFQECVRRRARRNLIMYPRIHIDRAQRAWLFYVRVKTYMVCDLTSLVREALFSLSRVSPVSRRINIPIPRELMIIYSSTSKSCAFSMPPHYSRGLLVTRVSLCHLRVALHVIQGKSHARKSAWI